MENLIIQLSKPIRIANRGDYQTVEILSVNLPNVANYNLYADIKSVIMESVLNLEDKLKVSDNQGEQQAGETQDKFPLELFLTSGTLKEVSEAINKYLINNATWDNEIKINANQIKKLSIQDYNNIIERVTYFLFGI